MVVQHNMTAMNAGRMLGMTTTQQSKMAEKLSSGYRINRAGDDAAGLKISEKMRSQIRGLQKASANAQDGISLIQTAEGALTETHSILQRMNELAVQAGNDTNTSTDRAAINSELKQLATEITRIAKNTEFNKQTLLNGTYSGKRLQVGANSGQVISITMGEMTASALSITATVTSIKSNSGAGASIKIIQNAIDKVSTQRSTLGALQNRLEHTVDNLDNVVENTQAAESRIRDTDMAATMVEYSKNQILAQVGQSMLAQGNQSTQGVLSLLQ